MTAYYVFDFLNPDRKEIYFPTEDEAKAFAERNNLCYDVLDFLSLSEYLKIIPNSIVEPITVPFDVI